MRRLFFLLFVVLLLSSNAFAEVEVRDDVSVTNKPVMLAARTKGLILPRGGELVEFSVDGKLLGKSLSGGDGWAFREFTPKNEKLYRIKAEAGEDVDEGYLLSLSEGRALVFIEVQGSLVETPFSQKVMEGSLDAVRILSEQQHIVYLSTELPAAAIRKWLDENGFPAAPLLKWQGGGVFDYVAEKGLATKAVIGSPSVVESTPEQNGPKLYTFGQADSATEVTGWDEIVAGIK